MQLFIKQIFFESTTDTTLVQKTDGVAESLEEEVGVVGVTAGKVGVGAGVVAVGTGIVVGADIAKMRAGTVGLRVNVVRADMGRAYMQGASV